MFKRSFLSISTGVLAVFIVCGFNSPSNVAAEPGHEFVSSQKCGMCHKKDEKGNQLKIWQESSHAKAFEVLGTQAAKDAGAKLGVTDPQKDGKCLKCHSTAYYFTEAKVTENVPVEEGISCETCHGPGKDYMKKSVMEDKDAAMAAGLFIPDEKTCVKCHNTDSPSYKAFDFKEFWEKIKHPILK